MAESNRAQSPQRDDERRIAAEMFIKQGDYAQGIKHAMGIGDTKIVINYGGSQHRVFDDSTAAKPVNKLTEVKALDILNAISTPATTENAAANTVEKLHIRIRVEENGQLVDSVKQSREQVVVLNTALSIQDRAVSNSITPPSGKQVDVPSATQPLDGLKNIALATAQVRADLAKVEAALGSVMRDVKNPSRELQWANRNLKQDFKTAKQYISNLRHGVLPTVGKVASSTTNFISSTVRNTGKELAWISKQTSRGSEALTQAAKKMDKAGNWVSRGMETWKANSAASHAYKAFEKGSDRIHSDTYEVGGYSISKVKIENQDRYVLSDTKGDSIIAFSVDEKGVKDLTLFNAYDYVEAKSAMKNADIVRAADPKLEKSYNDASKIVAQIAGDSLHRQNGPPEPNKASVLKGKSYSYEEKNETVTVKANGRGVILTRTADGKVESKLSKRDIEKFAPAIRQYQQVNQKVNVAANAKTPANVR